MIEKFLSRASVNKHIRFLTLQALSIYWPSRANVCWAASFGITTRSMLSPLLVLSPNMHITCSNQNNIFNLKLLNLNFVLDVKSYKLRRCFSKLLHRP